jgi:hypothetical protein
MSVHQPTLPLLVVQLVVVDDATLLSSSCSRRDTRSKVSTLIAQQQPVPVAGNL